jgi:hypothetical protein
MPFHNKGIALHEFDANEYRKFVRTLSDEELVKAGKRLRVLCGDVVTAIPSVFRMQLRIYREEYRRGIQEIGDPRQLLVGLSGSPCYIFALNRQLSRLSPQHRKKRWRDNLALMRFLDGL